MLWLGEENCFFLCKRTTKINLWKIRCCNEVYKETSHYSVSFHSIMHRFDLNRVKRKSEMNIVHVNMMLYRLIYFLKRHSPMVTKRAIRNKPIKNAAAMIRVDRLNWLSMFSNMLGSFSTVCTSFPSPLLVALHISCCLYYFRIFFLLDNKYKLLVPFVDWSWWIGKDVFSCSSTPDGCLDTNSYCFSFDEVAFVVVDGAFVVVVVVVFRRRRVAVGCLIVVVALGSAFVRFAART